VRAITIGSVASVLWLTAGVGLSQEPAKSQTPAAAKAAEAAPAGLRTGPATVAPHWSRYDYPKSVPEGAAYHIVERNDTLWDLAKRFLGSPYLWPQIWHENGYVKDAHWIYPGDPLLLPSVQVVAGQAGQAGVEGGATAVDEAGLMPTETTAGRRYAPGTKLIPVATELDALCAPYVPARGEPGSNLIVSSYEDSIARDSVVKGDIVFLNHGQDEGIKPGDVFIVNHPAYKIEHPKDGHGVGRKVQPRGTVRVLLAAEKASTAVIEASCLEILPGDFLTPYAKPLVPLVADTPAPHRLQPPSGKARGQVLDIDDNNDIGTAGHFVIVDLGEQDGVTPGTRLVIFRNDMKNAPTRTVVADAAVLSVRDRTSTVRVLRSVGGPLFIGDEIEVQ
jgi:hypothetical protein